MHKYFISSYLIIKLKMRDHNHCEDPFLTNDQDKERNCHFNIIKLKMRDHNHFEDPFLTNDQDKERNCHFSSTSAQDSLFQALKIIFDLHIIVPTLFHPRTLMMI
jgi:hypothetical protein